MSSSVARALLTVALVASTTTWLALVVVVPSWQGDHQPIGLRVAAATFHAASARVCHQRADRSFHTGGHQWPVCARCTGLYAGAFLGAWLAAIAAWRGRRHRTAGRAEALRWPLLLAMSPTAVTWALEYAGWLAFSNGTRCALAMPLGAFAAWLVTSMAAGTVE